MTLILGQASYHFVLQVSDRLVTKKGKQFDPIANKNVLYFARDGILSLGYTGLAFLDDIPADQWVAEKLIGYSYERGCRPIMLRQGPLPQWLSVGNVERLLIDELRTAFAKIRFLPNAGQIFFELQIAGWQWGRRKRHRPLLGGIIKEGVKNIETGRAPRHFGRNYAFALAPLHNAQFIDLPVIREALKNIRSEDEAEIALVNAIRVAAGRTTIIGPNCMSILLMPPQIHHVRIRYIGVPASAQLISKSDPKKNYVLPAAFSPWVIGPEVVLAPSIISGSFILNVRGFEVDIEAPDPSKPGSPGWNFVAAMGSITRPRP